MSAAAIPYAVLTGYYSPIDFRVWSVVERLFVRIEIDLGIRLMSLRIMYSTPTDLGFDLRSSNTNKVQLKIRVSGQVVDYDSAVLRLH